MITTNQIKLNALDIYRHYLPEISTGKNILCPFHDDKKTKSFSIYGRAEDLRFHCFGCGKQGDALNFIQEVENLPSVGEAIKKAKEILGLNGDPSEKGKESALSLERVKELKPNEGYRFNRLHEYHAGNPPYIKVIYKNTEGDKTALFFTKTPSRGYIAGRKSKPALYQQHLLTERPNAVVCYCEGEKDAENLAKLGFVAVTAGGATDFDGYFKHSKGGDFAGRDIVIFADNDEAGALSALKVAKALSGVARSVRRVDLKRAWLSLLGEEMPIKADISDFAENLKILYGLENTKEEIHELIKGAETVQANEQDSEKKDLLSLLLKWDDVKTINVRVEYLLDRLIPKGAVTLLFGRGGIGKTSLALQIGKAIAEGAPFADLPTIQAPVYFVDFENPLSVLKQRIENIGSCSGAFIWHISSDPPPPRLDSEKWELYNQLPAGLLVFDTLRASQLGDENNSTDMAVVIARLKELRDKGFTILLLHHTPKSSDAIYKGSTAILDLCDHVLSLEPAKNTEEEPLEFDSENLYRFGVRIKTRYEPHHIFLKFNPEAKGFELSKDPDIDKLQDILQILKRSVNPPIQTEFRQMIMNELACSDYEARRLIRKGEGIFWEKIRSGEGKGHRAICYVVLSSIYNHTTTKQTHKNLPFDKTNMENHPQTVDNVDLLFCQKGSQQINKTNEIIDLMNVDFDVIE